MSNSEEYALLSLGAIRVAVPIILFTISISVGNLKRPTTRIELVENELPEEITINSPRRAPIISSLIIVSMTYFLDGVCFLLQPVIGKTWTRSGGLGSGVTHSSTIGLDFESVAGLVATGLLASVGTWKDLQGLPVWSLRRLKVWALAALVGAVGETILELAMGINEATSSHKVWSYLHTAFLCARILSLALLLMALAYHKSRQVSSQERPSLESGATDGNEANSEIPASVSTQSSSELVSLIH